MRKSLGELINTALSDADSALKLASARDAEIRSSGDFLDAELSMPKLAAEDSFSEKERAGTKKVVEAHERKMHGESDDDEEKNEKKSARGDILGAASYAMKLAEALEVGAHVVAKVAADTDPGTHEQKVTVSTGGAGATPIKAPGPQVMAGGFINAQTVQPKAQSAGAERIVGPTTTAGNLPTTIADHTGHLDGEQPPNNTGKTAGFTRSKEASARLLRAKQAQAETLMRMGQIKEAERLLAEVEKAAQDPSSPGPELPAHSNSYMLSTEPGDSTMIPDNSGLISMSKAQAKDRSVRTATEYVGARPKLDNAVAAHSLTTQGQKVSSLVVNAVEAEKVAAPLPKVKELARRVAEKARAALSGSSPAGTSELVHAIKDSPGHLAAATQAVRPIAVGSPSAIRAVRPIAVGSPASSAVKVLQPPIKVSSLVVNAVEAEKVAVSNAWIARHLGRAERANGIRDVVVRGVKRSPERFHADLLEGAGFRFGRSGRNAQARQAIANLRPLPASASVSVAPAPPMLTPQEMTERLRMFQQAGGFGKLK
ncbi:MAG: hypothetical protein ACO32I_04760 [Candidatus Limnocylindrus sp.]